MLRHGYYWTRLGGSDYLAFRPQKVEEVTMRYPVALHTGDGKSFGVTMPDIQGCFSAGGNEDEALDNAREAILGHLELLAQSGVL